MKTPHPHHDNITATRPQAAAPLGEPAVPHYVAADWERYTPEPTRSKEERSQAEIDRSRIIHSAAFRRLQGKTQIFGVAKDDFFRTRLTHSLEVAQIAKGIALVVEADRELVEAISLAHDIGHPPFGHAGERELNRCMCEKKYGFFESNAQNLRTLTCLEMKKTKYDGLNLTRATLDGLLKHRTDSGTIIAYASERDLVTWITRDAPPNETAFETQIVDWADQIAYSVHDLEDGIHAGLITSARLRDPELKKLVTTEVAEVYPYPEKMQGTFEFLTGAVSDIEETHDARKRSAKRKQLTSQLIHRFVTAAKAEKRTLADGSPGQGRYAFKLEVNPKEFGQAAVLKSIARRLIVQDQRVATLERRSTYVIERLFKTLSAPGATTADLYPDEFRPFIEGARDDAGCARVACDYIAGMTDNYAERLYHRLFSPGAGSLFEPL